MNEYPNNESGLLEELEKPPIIPAGHGRRLANYLIDLLLFYFFLVILLGFYPPLYNILIQDKEATTIGKIMVVVMYGMFMGLTEVIFKGRSPGKLMTKTMVVYEHNGAGIDNQTALLRGLIRAVPFEAFSALLSPCVPWHDRWTKTRVVLRSSIA